MELIEIIKIKADFLKFSACEILLAKLYALEGVVGLVQSFLNAGVNGLAVSFWSVADKPTAIFMIDVY